MDRVRERFLVLQFQQGNSDAFLKLVQAFERRLLYFLSRFERDPERALDTLQEVWLHAWKTRSSLRSPDNFRAWVYRIAHGKVVTAIRKEARQRQVAEQRQSPPPVGSNASDAMESAEMVHFALSRMSPVHREVLTLRFLEGLSIPEISFATGCPIGTAKSRLHHASQEITAILQEQIHAGKPE